MKRENNMKAKANIIIFLIIGIFFTLLPNINKYFNFQLDECDLSSHNRDEMNFKNEDLKISALSGKIHIINNSGWVAFKDAGNCTGEGTYSEPYVIEDLVIDGGGSGSCILIENSDVYFRIENCSVYNLRSYPLYGINLSNVNNSLIITNKCSSNYYGIFLSGCYNNTILENTVDNNRYGIYFYVGDNNTISGNIINNNNRVGIYIINGRYYTISGNLMNKCGLGLYGFDLEELMTHNIDTTNLVNGKPLYYYTNEVNLEPINYTNAGQVILVNCNDSLISNLITSYCLTGISLFYCNNNNISGNTANNNKEAGIYLLRCNNNTILGNTANYNFNGIYLLYSDHNTISVNTVIINDHIGICLTYSDNNTILGNMVNTNKNYGIFLHGNNNTISENTANNNFRGIYLSNSDNNTILGNMVNTNDYLGITIYDSHNNTISGNTANNNYGGIYLGLSDYNTISGNILNDNIDRGIYLDLSDYNTISGNTANNNKYGIYLSYSDYNIVSGNIFLGNDECIKEVYGCKGNTFENNDCGNPFELVIILISIISGGVMVSVVSILLIKHKKKRIQ